MVCMASDNEPIRVMLVDDHEIVRRGVRDLLETADDVIVVGEAGSAADVMPTLEALAAGDGVPDVALLDVQLGDGSGVAVCRDIRSAYPAVSCLMLTSYADDEALLDSVIAGAQGYVLKQVRGNDLVDHVRSVAAGRSLVDPATLSRVRAGIRERAADRRALGTLTERERSILDLLADGLTNREIGERLYVSEKTVKNNMSSVLTKLGMQRRTEAALYAARHRREEGRP